MIFFFWREQWAKEELIIMLMMLWTIQTQEHHLFIIDFKANLWRRSCSVASALLHRGIPPSTPALSAASIDHLSVNNCALPAIHPRDTLLEHQAGKPLLSSDWVVNSMCLLMTGRHSQKVYCSDVVFPSIESIHGNWNCFLVLCAAATLQWAEPHPPGEQCRKLFQ